MFCGIALKINQIRQVDSDTGKVWEASQRSTAVYCPVWSESFP